MAKRLIASAVFCLVTSVAFAQAPSQIMPVYPGPGAVPAGGTGPGSGMLVDASNAASAAFGNLVTAATAASARTSLGLGTGNSPTFTGLTISGLTGILASNGASGVAARTLTGTSNRITVTNGDGVSSNPTLDISSSYVGQATITTVGTIGTGTWSANISGATLTGGLTATGQTITGGTFAGITLSGTTVATGFVQINRNAASLPAALSGTAIQIGGADGSGPRLMMEGFASSPALNFRRADGTAASPSAVQVGGFLGNITSLGYGATGYSSGSRAQISLIAAENWTDTSQGTYIDFYTTLTGTASISPKMRLQASGGLTLGNGIITTDPGAGNLLVSGSITSNFSGSGPSTGFRSVVSSGISGYSWGDLSQATNQKYWDAIQFGTQLAFRSVNDANSAANNWMTVNRGSGAVISNVIFPNGSTGFAGTPDGVVRVDIWGLGNTSSTYGLAVRTSTGGVNNFLVRDDGLTIALSRMAVGITTDPGAGNLLVSGTTQANIFRNAQVGTNVRILYVTNSTGSSYSQWASTGAAMLLGIEDSVGATIGQSAYSTVFGTQNSTPLVLITNNTARATISAAGGFSIGPAATPDPGTGNFLVAGLGTFANLALASYGQIALPTGNGVGRVTGLYNALGGNHDYIFLSDNYNYATSTIDSSILGTVGVVLTAVNAGGGGNVRIQTGATNTAPSTRLQVDGNGITVTGAIQLGNAFVAGTPVLAGYVTVKDSTGTTYKLLAAP